MRLEFLKHENKEIKSERRSKRHKTKRAEKRPTTAEQRKDETYAEITTQESKMCMQRTLNDDNDDGYEERLRQKQQQQMKRDQNITKRSAIKRSFRYLINWACSNMPLLWVCIACM